MPIPLWIKIVAPIAIIASFVLAVFVILGKEYDKGFDAGKAACQNIFQTKQSEHKVKVKHAYDKIDQNMPNAGDIDAVDQFLLQHVR